jgi:ATP-dependent DNA helicase RecG
MQPAILKPLFAALTTLPGVGPKVDKLYRHLLRREHGARVVDLLFHMPTGAIDRRARPKLKDVVPGSVVTVAVTIDRHRPPPPRRPRVPYLVYASDDTGDVVLTYFNARRDYIERTLPKGRYATSRAPLRFTTARCRLCTPTALWTKPGWCTCRWSNRSIL